MAGWAAWESRTEEPRGLYEAERRGRLRSSILLTDERITLRIVAAMVPFPFEAVLVASAALAMIAVAYLIVRRWW
jgi:hypothetical protein